MLIVESAVKMHLAISCHELVNGQKIAGFWSLRIIIFQALKGISLGPLDLICNGLWIIQQIDAAQVWLIWLGHLLCPVLQTSHSGIDSKLCTERKLGTVYILNSVFCTSCRSKAIHFHSCSGQVPHKLSHDFQCIARVNICISLENIRSSSRRPMLNLIEAEFIMYSRKSCSLRVTWP